MSDALSDRGLSRQGPGRSAGQEADGLCSGDAALPYDFQISEKGYEQQHDEDDVTRSEQVETFNADYRRINNGDEGE